jgi:hypothetical protein
MLAREDIFWCQSCYIRFAELTLPTLGQPYGSRLFEMTPFIRATRDAGAARSVVVKACSATNPFR